MTNLTVIETFIPLLLLYDLFLAYINLCLEKKIPAISPLVKGLSI